MSASSSGGGKMEASGVGDSPESDEDLIAIERDRLVALLKSDLFFPCFRIQRGRLQRCPGINLEVLPLGESLLECCRDVRVCPRKKLSTPLDHTDFFSESFKIAGHLQGDRSATEDKDALGNRFCIQDIVAGPVSNFLKSGYGNVTDTRAGRDETASKFQFIVRAAIEGAHLPRRRR